MAAKIVTRLKNHNDEYVEALEKKAAEILGDAMAARGYTRVEFIDCLGEPPPPDEPKRDVFQVLCNVGFEQNRGHAAPPGVMWGHRVTFPMFSGPLLFNPSGDGLMITEPRTGLTVAELIGSRLHVLFPVLNISQPMFFGRPDADVFGEILRETLPLVKSALPTLEMFVNGQVTPLDRHVIADMQQDVSRARSESERHIAHATALRGRLAKLMNHEADATLTRLREIPEISSLKFSGNDLHISTRTMYCDDPWDGSIREFGQFDIFLRFGADRLATFNNTTRKVHCVGLHRDGAYGHPHVQDPHNYWCAGEGVRLFDLLRDYEFEASVLFALRAIATINDVQHANIYRTVLQKFPTVHKRMAYPTAPAALRGNSHADFVQLFRSTIGRTVAEINASIDLAEVTARAGIRQTFDGTWAKTVTRMPADQVAFAKRMNAAIQQVRTVKEVADFSVTSNLLTVNVQNRLQVEFDFAGGGVRYLTPLSRPIGESNILHDDGALRSSESSLTIAELLGSMDLEAAVSVAIDVSTSL